MREVRGDEADGLGIAGWAGGVCWGYVWDDEGLAVGWGRGRKDAVG